MKDLENLIDRNSTLKERYCGISASSLHKFELSPKLFKAYIDGEIVEEEKPWLELGTKLHMYLLEPEEFKENYIYLEFSTPNSAKQKEFCEELVKLNNKFPTLEDASELVYRKIYSVSGKSDEKIKEESKKLTKTLKKYITYLQEKNHYKDVITYSTQKFLNDARFAVNTHVKAKELLLDTALNTECANEQRILWEYPKFQIKDEPMVLKSFIDRFIINHDKKEISLIDLKTTSNIGEFEDRFENFNYKRQLALYWLALGYYLKQREDYQTIKEYSNQTYVVVIQTTGGNLQLPIECRVYPISESTLGTGLNNLDKILTDIAWHFQNDKWDHTKQYYESQGVEQTL